MSAEGGMELKALDLMDKAKKYAEARSFFMSAPKYDRAAECYSDAANQFKGARKWKEAGEAFILAGQMCIKAGEIDEAASQFVNAASAFKKVLPQNAIDAYQQAISIFTEKGRWSTAAGHQKSIAELYETEITDLAKALEAYEMAADWYAGEDSPAHANTCLLKVAHFAAQLEDYNKAIEVFEKVGSGSINNNLLKFGAREHFLKAGLCFLARGDPTGARLALQRYEDMFPDFVGSREAKLLHDLCEATDNKDVDAFSAVLRDYDRLTRLDGWKTNLLLKVKNAIAKAEVDDGIL